MPGMKSGLNLGNPLLAAAFRSALLHQGMVALLVFGVLALAWVSVREWRPPGAGAGGAGSTGAGSTGAGSTGVGSTADVAGAPAGRPGGGRALSREPEPSWRMLLRIGFGL